MAKRLKSLPYIISQTHFLDPNQKAILGYLITFDPPIITTSKAIQKNIGIKKDSYFRAISDLKDKKVLETQTIKVGTEIKTYFRKIEFFPEKFFSFLKEHYPAKYERYKNGTLNIGYSDIPSSIDSGCIAKPSTTCRSGRLRPVAHTDTIRNTFKEDIKASGAEESTHGPLEGPGSSDGKTKLLWKKVKGDLEDLLN